MRPGALVERKTGHGGLESAQLDILFNVASYYIVHGGKDAEIDGSTITRERSIGLGLPDEAIARILFEKFFGERSKEKI